MGHIVVTGAAGMVGSHVVDRLLQRGDQVLGVDNLLTGDVANLAGALDHGGFTFLEQDAADLVELPPGTDAVLHLGSPASPRHFRDLPIEILHAGSTATLRLLALAGEPLTIHGDGSQTRTLGYVDDVARGIVDLLDSDVTVPVNLGAADELTVLEIARLVLELTGSTSELVFVDRPEHDPDRRCPDLTRARELLGWQPEVGVADGLRRTIESIAAQLGPSAAGPAPVVGVVAR